MPKYTLQYFNVKALGETIRLLLAYGGEDFEDVRVSSEEWPKIKDSTPFGQMPVLTFDGKKYSQSTSISRFLGKTYGVAGANPKEDLEIDMNIDFVHDIRSKAAAVFYEKDETIKAQKHEESKEIIAQLLTKLNSIVVENNGHIALKKLTWGDFVFTGLFDYLKVMVNDSAFDTKYPSLVKVVKTVEALPSVKKYVEKRPKSDF